MAGPVLKVENRIQILNPKVRTSDCRDYNGGLKIKMEIIKNNQGYRLLVKHDAIRKQYENVVNYLISKLQLRENDVHDVDDFDSYYISFNHHGNEIVLSQNTFLEIWVYFSDKNINADTQEKTLKELSEVLSGLQF